MDNCRCNLKTFNTRQEIKMDFSEELQKVLKYYKLFGPQDEQESEEIFVPEIIPVKKTLTPRQSLLRRLSL